jgi:steroid delta-isomerase-like uncharacterized protein
MATDMEKTVKDWIAAWNSHDVVKAMRFYTDDCTVENVAAGTARHGKNEATANLKTTFVDTPDFKLEQKATFISENGVCGEVIMSGTPVRSSNPAIPVTGKHYSVRVAYLTEWEKGKIKRHSVYWDNVAIMQQLGLMPGSPK